MFKCIKYINVKLDVYMFKLIFYAMYYFMKIKYKCVILHTCVFIT